MAKTSKAHSPDASTRLRENLEKVVRTWEERLRRTLSAASTQESPALRDTLPGFLVSLADALTSDSKIKDACANTEICKAHGAQRSVLAAYHPEHLVWEFYVLQSVLFDFFEDEAPLGRHERDIVLRSIFAAVQESTAEFSRVQEDFRRNFFLTLTHDLRGPLTAAKASAEVIVKYPKRIDIHSKFAHRVVENVERVDRMITDILDASRLQLGERLQIEIGECDLYEMATDLIDDLETVHGERFVLQAKPPISGHWSCDGIRRSLENLLSNAVKYGYKNTPILVGISRSGDHVTLSVHNEGEPLPAEDMADLFQPFRRTKTAEKGGKSGWGLGLSLVRGVSEAHGGAVSVESAPGKGTTFKLVLPVDARRFQQQT